MKVRGVANFQRSQLVKTCQRGSRSSQPGHGGRPAGSERVVTAESVSKLCHQGHVTESVEALGVLVQTECCVPISLLQTVLQKCSAKKDLALSRRVHAFTVRNGYQSDTFLCNHILRMYASHGRLQEAMDVFTAVGKPDAFMWSSIISAHSRHGQDKQAIQLYHQMRRACANPDGHVFVAALQACAKGGDLQSGQQVHADVLSSGVEPGYFVSSSLVDMYAKCGSLEDARTVFEGLGEKNVVTWNAMIAGYSQQGMGREALCLYSEMQEGGMVAPDAVTFVCLLLACASVGTPALDQGKELHAQIRGQEHKADVFIGNSLVNMYAKCGSLVDARAVFEGLGQKNVVTWNAMITGYCQEGMGREAITLYSRMQEEGMVAPDYVTFVCLLQACASVGTTALEKGRQLHAHIREEGHEGNVIVCNSLVDMYAKCGSLEDAQRVFDGLARKDVVTWNAIIAGYCQQGMGQKALSLYSSMQDDGTVAPNSMTFVCLLQACGSLGTLALEKGSQVHAQITDRGHQIDVFVGNNLVYMYAKCGSLRDARRVFDKLSEKDVVTWNAMIAGYSQQGLGQEALSLYSAMQEEGMATPDSKTFVYLLQACSSAGNSSLEKGKQLHAQIKEQGHLGDEFVASSLIAMYAKCGSLEDACRVFDGLGHKNVVTWNAMIAGYSQQGMGREALCLYSNMQEEGMAAPDSVTFLCLLQACASVGTPALEQGKELHARIGEQGLQGDVVVASSLVTMYAKCGSLENAHRVFERLGRKDVVAWNSMLAGYSQQGTVQEALRLYSAMQEAGKVAPDAVTFVCLLQACADVAALHLGRQLHAQIQEQRLQGDVLVANSLINMYGKSGSMIDAQQVFEALPERDCVTWNALIAGYTRQGDSAVVFDLVGRMREVGIQADGITFLHVLTVCSHAGLVDQGRQYFEAMSNHYSITPTVEHYTCMVDLLGRAGRLDESLALVGNMPVPPTAAVWHTLLGACRKWNNVEVAHHAFHEAVKLDKQDAAAYVLMSNIYTEANMWEQAQEMQARRIEIRAWKQPGQTWTEWCIFFW